MARKAKARRKLRLFCVDDHYLIQGRTDERGPARWLKCTGAYRTGTAGQWKHVLIFTTTEHAV